VNNDLVIETKALTKTFYLGDLRVEALREIDLKIEHGEFVAVMGSSGSGKSTLMNLLGCLDSPSSGEYWLEGRSIGSMNRKEYANIRNQKIGFVFQGFNLLPRANALENVELPLIYDRKMRVKDPKQAALEALESVGLSDRLMHEPNQLSGGQQQRVAIARALVCKPSILLADEPTGNLDSTTSIDVLSVFQKLNNDGITVVLVTHETDIAGYAKRIVKMKDGIIVSDKPVSERKDAENDLDRIRNLSQET
jgi:putative ABC transport system ATP-binding protein